MRPLRGDIFDAPPFQAFLADMAALGVTPVVEGGRAYAVIAARSNARWWLLPIDNRGAARAGLEMLQPVSWTARVAKTMAGWVAQLGPHRFLGRGQIRLSGLPNLEGAFAGLEAHVACFTGTDGPHRKTALQVLDMNAAILGYAKLSREGHVRPYLRNEAWMLRHLSGLKLASAHVPALLGLRDDEAVTLLITDSLKSTSHNVALELGPKHLAFLEELRSKSVKTGAEATLNWLKDEAVRLTQTAGAAWTARLGRVIELLQPQAASIQVCLTHGDFTPWNCFEQAGRLYVFDWEYAQDLWPVGFDLAHFHLAMAALDAQPAKVPFLLDALARTHFEGDRGQAGNALLLSLACHAAFYLGRLHDAGQPLVNWPAAAARASMIDRLLTGVEGTP